MNFIKFIKGLLKNYWDFQEKVCNAFGFYESDFDLALVRKRMRNEKRMRNKERMRLALIRKRMRNEKRGK